MRTLLEVIPIHIQIGEAKTLDVENWQVIPDDRQEAVEIIGGKVVQDFGHVAAGDKISCTVSVMAKDWELIKAYWDNREFVMVTDEAGNVWEAVRVVVKNYSYVAHFPKVHKVSLEFWRV